MDAYSSPSYICSFSRADASCIAIVHSWRERRCESAPCKQSCTARLPPIGPTGACRACRCGPCDPRSDTARRFAGCAAHAEEEVFASDRHTSVTKPARHAQVRVSLRATACARKFHEKGGKPVVRLKKKFSYVQEGCKAVIKSQQLGRRTYRSAVNCTTLIPALVLGEEERVGDRSHGVLEPVVDR